MWIMLAICSCCLYAGPGKAIGESGEYRMERVRVVYFHIQSSEGGSPRMCRLKTASVGPL
jgi:hypothetical protein